MKQLSPLSIAYSTLSPCLFKNQSMFYNMMFGFILHQDLIPALSEDIKNIYSDSIPFNIDTMKKFYAISTDCCSLTEFKSYSSTNEFKSAFEHKPVPLFSGVIVSHNREVKNKTINGHSGRNIPGIWLERYDKNGDTKSEYCNYTAWVLQYYYIILKNSNGAIRAQKNIPENVINDNYTEYYSFSAEDKKKIECSTGITINSFLDLAKYIHTSIQEQVSYNLKIGLYATSDTSNKSKKGSLHRAKTLEADLRQYHDYIYCYGAKNIDRFNALKRQAQTNTFCANELGSIYYYGETFYNCGNAYEIKKDYAIAAEYYNLCITDELVNPSGCWSLGYMILEGEYIPKNGDRIEQARNLFERCGKYGPAKNSLAKIERELGDNCYKEYMDLYTMKPHKRKSDYSIKLETAKKEAVEHYIKALNMARDAANYGWLYSYNVIYDILSSQAIKMLHDDIIAHPDYEEMDKIELLRHAANMKSSWSMDKLACEIMSKDNVSEEERKEAHTLLVEAAKQNYPKALDHLNSLF